MPDVPSFDADSVDIAASLKSRTLMGKFRGKEVYALLRERILALRGTVS